MKYLKVFQTESDYNTAKDNLTYPTVSHIADSGENHYVPIHKRTIPAVFYDSSTGSFVKLYPEQITEVIPTYTPIGVEVIPVEHDVYGTGQAGIMSLAEMSYNIPDTGSSEYQYMYWGGNYTDTSLPNYNKVNLVDGAITGDAYLPSDQFTGATSLDGVSKYGTTVHNAPSPFNADGSRNEAYYTTAYSTANAFSDFDGVGNTKVLTDVATAQSDWKTASTITNNSGVGYYPPACCCWRFHTAGTNQGQWYLPACGELGYVVNRLSAINETINKVLSVYSSVAAVGVHTSYDYWSSSEFSADGARGLNTYTGDVDNDGKVDYGYVRAFLRL